MFSCRPILCLTSFAMAAATGLMSSRSAAEPVLPGIGPALQAMVDQHEIAGAVTVVVSKDGILHLENTGLADVASQKPMTAESLFWIASMTQPSTGTAVLMLQDEGKLNVADPVAKYLPEFAGLKSPSGKPANLTITQILTHTSGLGEAGGPAAKEAETLADLVPLWLAAPMQYEPGAKWAYTQSGINAAARIVEVVSGLTFDAFLQQRLFDPLGMKSTTFYPTDAQRARLVTAYAKNKDTGLLEAVPPREGYGTRGRPPQGNGGLFSTPADYARFCRMLLNGGALDGAQILSPKTIELMTANHIPGGQDLTQMSTSLFSEAEMAGIGFGLGFATTIDSAATLAPCSNGDFYWGGMYSTAFFVDPVEDIIMIFMTQLLPSTTYPVRREIKTMIYSALTA